MSQVASAVAGVLSVKQAIDADKQREEAKTMMAEEKERQDTLIEEEKKRVEKEKKDRVAIYYRDAQLKAQRQKRAAATGVGNYSSGATNTPSGLGYTGVGKTLIGI